MPEWTLSQLEAVGERDKDLLVAAAAGAGKTAVLVERIIRRITDPDDPLEVDRILVVTFTNAAAAQMRQRIGAALTECLARRPGAKTRRQLLLLNMADINTLHAFCLDLVRSHYYHLGLAPSFRVAGEDEAALIRENVLDELLEKRYEEGDPLFLALSDDYGGEKGDDSLAELVLRLYEFSRSHPDPAAWLAGAAAAFSAPGADLDELVWSACIRESVGLAIERTHDLLVQALAGARAPGGPAAYAAVLSGDLDMVADLRQCLDRPWARLREAFREIAWARLPACREGDEELLARVRALRERAKDALKEVRERFLAREPGDILADLHRLAPAVNRLADLVREFAEAYRQAKLARGLVDFGDLEHFALRLLTGPDGAPSAPARALRERYAEVLVDEYQDINPVQETILQLVSRGANLFMVGDVKQSIYRFRLADPGLFLDKYRHFPTRPGGRQRRVDLTENFRSRPEIIRAVNFLFRQIMTPKAGEMAYGPAEELCPGAPPPDGPLSGPVELYVLEPPEGDTEDVTAVEREARLLAGRIGEMLSGRRQVWEEGCFRLLAPRDIVVLLRATRGVAETFLAEFRRRGIPAAADAGGGFDAATEVETVLSLLRIIDNPLQDIPLAAVLRSPLVGLSAAELAQLRLARPGDPFHRAARDGASRLAGTSRTRLEAFWSRLELWRAQARQGRLSDLIWRICRETGFYDYAGAMPGGAVRQANLRTLYDRARQFERTSFSGLFDFLRFVEHLREQGRDTAGTATDAGDAVRIMSVHKSKGLEFPVVGVAGLGRSFNLRDARARTVLHKDLGIGPDVVDRELGIRYPGWAKLAIREKMVRESLAEEMRILYVALTRAREKLLLVGSVRNLAARLRDWSTYLDWPGVALPDSCLLAAGDFLDWIGPAVLRHRDWQGGGSPVRDDPSRWEVYCPAHAPAAPAGESPPVDAEFWALVRRGQALPVPGDVARRVGDSLDWVYPHQEAVGRPAKIGVTELKRRLALPDETARPLYRPVVRPRFLQATGELSTAEQGTVWHLVLQHLDLAGDLSPAGIAAQIRTMQENLLLNEHQAAVVDPAALARLFAGALGRRLVAGRVRRELPFGLLVAAGEVRPEPAGRSEDEPVLVQGVIDCLVEEEDGFLLVDWKTDRVVDAERYRPQLDLYARAVETVFRRPVRDRYLYFLRAEEAVPLV